MASGKESLLLLLFRVHSRMLTILRPFISLTRGMALRQSMSWEDKAGHIDGSQSCPADYSA